MNDLTNASSDRRSDAAEAREVLSPETVQLLLLCGADVREADRTASRLATDADSRRGVGRRDGERRRLERRFIDRRHDERRASF